LIPKKKKEKHVFFFKGGEATGTKSVLSVFVVFSFGFKSQREKAKKKKKNPVRDLCARSAHCLSS
jgi:hypothetical protein